MRSQPKRIHATLLVIFSTMMLAQTAHSKEDLTNGWAPTPLEIQELPNFCQAQFVESLKGEPTPRTYCGIYMNHYCPAVVLVNRASRYSGTKTIKKSIVARARSELEYTKKYLTPSCSLIPHINATESRLRMLELIVK